MILQRLAEHYDRIVAMGNSEDDIAPPGFSRQKISFRVVLNLDGTLNSIQSLPEKSGSALVARPMTVPGQAKPPGQGINPCFLWDNAAYMLGWSKDSEKLKRAQLSFEAFRQKHLDLETQINHPSFNALCTFLRNWSPDQALQYEEILIQVATNFGVFRIAGQTQYLHEVVSLPMAQDIPVEDQAVAMCLVTGAMGEVARLHEPTIKGVSGAQSSGALLVSFNAASYASYGKSQSYNAPVSSEVAFKYANALNSLLARRDRRVSLGDATVVFWADHADPLEDFLSDLFSNPLPNDDATIQEDPERLRQAQLLLTQLREGTYASPEAEDGPKTKFYLLGLSPNASRISVRYWVEAEAAELRKRLSLHVQDIELSYKSDERLLTLRRMVAATGRAEHDAKGRLKSYDTDNVSPQLAGELARSVLTGSAYPQTLLATMLRRIHSDSEVAYARVAAIKACLTRNARLRGNSLEDLVTLDPAATNAAYNCGRLFALLEKAQTDSADGELNSTIKDRYFSSASSTPAIVFPRLFRLSQHHLGKLSTGHRISYDRQFGAVMQQIDAFPRQLSLEDQGKFVIGYFHQRQDLWTSKKDKQEGENA